MKVKDPEQSAPQLNITPIGNELTIRYGDALPVAYDKAINLSGVLAAPFQFYSKKFPEAISSHITIKRDTGVITLHINDSNAHSECVITGQLKKDGALEQWKINSEKRWSVTEFLKHIKTQAFYFTDKDELKALISSLQTWNAKIETVIRSHNDNSGNSLASLEKKVSEVGLKNNFSLTIPIFQGYAKQKFTVEIGLDPKSNSVDLFLISEDLFTMEIELREKLIDEELSKFDDFQCSKVVLS
jgi:hypothetical protein